MTMRNLSTLLWFALALAAASGVTACDDDDDDDSGVSDDDAADDDAADDDAADDDAVDDDAADDDDDNDAADDDDDNDTGSEIFNIAFDDYTAGLRPPAPWLIDETVPDSVLAIPDPTKKADNVLEISGDTITGSWAKAMYPFTMSLDVLRVSFWVYNNGGAGFGFEIESETTDWLMQLLNVPTTYELEVYAGGAGPTVCATISPAAWHKVEVVINPSTGLFDVLLNDAATACADLTADADTVVGASFLDFSDDGWGGIVYYDDFIGVEY